MTKLFLRGLPAKMDEMQLAQLIGPFGDIELLTIVRDKFSGESKGFGFVHMKTEEGAKQAIAALNGFEAAAGKLEVRLAGDKPEPKPVLRPGNNNTPVKKKRPRLAR